MESSAAGSELDASRLHFVLTSFHIFWSLLHLLSYMEKTVIFAPLFGACSALAQPRGSLARWGDWSRKWSPPASIHPYTCHGKFDCYGTFHFPHRPFWSGTPLTRFPTILGGSPGCSAAPRWEEHCRGLLLPRHTLVWAAWNSKSPAPQTLFVSSL